MFRDKHGQLRRANMRGTTASRKRAPQQKRRAQRQLSRAMRTPHSGALVAGVTHKHKYVFKAVDIKSTPSELMGLMEMRFQRLEKEKRKAGIFPNPSPFPNALTPFPRDYVMKGHGHRPFYKAHTRARVLYYKVGGSAADITKYKGLQLTTRVPGDSSGLGYKGPWN